MYKRRDNVILFSLFSRLHFSLWLWDSGLFSVQFWSGTKIKSQKILYLKFPDELLYIICYTAEMISILIE